MKKQKTKIYEQDIDINPEFQKAFSILEDTQHSLFLTGKAGTGKSTFLEYFTQNTKKDFAVLAPTGVAALNVNGETIHSFFHFHPHVTKKEVEKKASRVKKDSIFHHLDLIIIDEISMVRADLFDYIDIFLRKALHKNEPFGGVQMCLIGDLYQLPPIVMSDEKAFFKENYASHYFFGTDVFLDPFFIMEFVELQNIYRQREDEFISVLNAIRNNNVDEYHMEFLNNRVGNIEDEDEYITIVPTNRQADQINNQNLARLDSSSKKYKGKTEGKLSSGSYPTELELTLKKGAKVMFLNNDSEHRWVNGTLGCVVGLSKDSALIETTDGVIHEVKPHKWEVNKYVYDQEANALDQELVGSFEQFPLRLAWAITIHKSQGKTFDNVILDMGSGSFAPGQLYVALSRCRTSEGLVIRSNSRMNIVKTDEDVEKFLSGFR